MARRVLLLACCPASCAAVVADPAAVGPARLADSLYRRVLSALPVPTVDVLVFSADLSKTLLFLRTMPPVQNQWYSIGGRLLKNEPLRVAAVRKLREETKLRVAPSELVLGGVVEEASAQPDTRAPRGRTPALHGGAPLT